MPHLPPGTPFEGKGKGILESGHRLTGKVRLEDPSETPSIDTLEPRHPDYLDGAKRRLCTVQSALIGRPSNQGHIMELGECCPVRIGDIGNADTLRITVRSQQQAPQSTHKSSSSIALLRSI